MQKNKMVNIYLYSRYERFWHWFQSALIIILLLTGFELHGTFSLFGFRSAVDVHNFVGLSWLILFAFFIFWLFTTGEFRQYIPTTRKMLAVVRYYSYGIFRGKPTRFPNAGNSSTTRCNGLYTCRWLRCCCRFRWLPAFCTGATTPGRHGGWNGCRCR